MWKNTTYSFIYRKSFWHHKEHFWSERFFSSNNFRQFARTKLPFLYFFLSLPPSLNHTYHISGNHKDRSQLELTEDLANIKPSDCARIWWICLLCFIERIEKEYNIGPNLSSVLPIWRILIITFGRVSALCLNERIVATEQMIMIRIERRNMACSTLSRLDILGTRQLLIWKPTNIDKCKLERS